MVLFKRKPVAYCPPPKVENDDTEVWVIQATGEYFTEYEAYLARVDFYKQRRFICQITGHSGLSFFEALKSELAGAQEVEQAFPEALKGPILRRVQFQTISRIDTLVDLIFEEFRADYYPGEAVTVHVVTGERLPGVVRDKTRFGSKPMPDGSMAPGFSRYFVSLDNRPTEEAVVDDAHITRDRKIFTKQVLRSFIKKTVTREAWTGAPWLVKPDVAAIYHIDTRVPPHLRYENKAAERKQKQQAQKAGTDYDGMVGSFHQGQPQGQGNGSRLPELKPAPKSHKSKQVQQQQSQQQGQAGKGKQQPFLNPAPSNPNPPQFIPQPPYLSHNFQAAGPPPQVGPHFANFHNATFAFQQPIASLPPQPPPPPPIKYPIEDLQVQPRHNGLKRPELKFFSQDTPLNIGQTKGEGNGILMKSIGPLLETWDTLNVYCGIFKLDSFTFDDFVEAMQFSSEDVECELFTEVHCATLKLLVQSEHMGGKVEVQLPEMEEESDDEEGAEASAPPTPEPEPEPKPKGRATRASLKQAEAEALRAEPEPVREPTPEPKSTHRAAEMQQEIGWIDRLRKRDFKNGGWQIIMIGLLYQLSKNPRRLAECEPLLKQLAPLNMDPTPETARVQYAKLNVNLRIQALQIACSLCNQTKDIRGSMEENSDHMTELRKEKIDLQRNRKALTEELRLLNEERKIQLPANMPPSPVLETKTLNGDVSMPDAPEEVHDSIDDEVGDTDDDAKHGRSLRRNNDRLANRKRKREEEQQKKEKAEAEAKLPKQTKQFTKLLKDIQKKQEQVNECERNIAILDNDLREADVPRTRVLGKDRYWNRYYWFERNGMPYAGLPNSSTAEAGYANGCIWVQGPDDLEREGYIDMKPDWQNEYIAKFGLTVPERKKMEEGATSVFNAHQWGYYDEPEQLDRLISFLDTRGLNEVKLHKELKLYRDRIIKNMEKRKEYLHPTPIDEKASVTESSTTSKRMSTRRKEQPVEHLAHRCLAWHNTMAVNEIGHTHYDQPRARRPAKKAQEAKAARDTVVVEEERVTRSEGRGKGKKAVDKYDESEAPTKGKKGLGRQGTRYNFEK